MAINYNSGITSLDAGASDITYSGDQGPKSPDQQLMASADPMLVEEYNKYVFEMEEQGLQPISFKEFVQQIMSEANMAQGGIARLGYRGGQLVQPGPGRPGYQGPAGGSHGSYGGSSSPSHGGGGGGGHHRDDPVTQTARPYQPPTRSRQESQADAVVEQARAQAAQVAEANRVNQLAEARAKMTQEAPVDVPGRERVLDLVDPYRQNYISPGQILSLPVAAGPVTDVEEQAKQHNIRISPAKQKLIEEAALKGRSDLLTEGDIGLDYVRPPMLGDVGGSMDYMSGSRLTAEDAANMENIIATPPEPYVNPWEETSVAGGMPGYVEPYVNPWEETSVAGGMPGYVSTPPRDDDGGGGGDGGGLGDQGIMSAPVVAEEAADTGTDLAAVREAAIAEAATKSGLPFEHYYVGGDPTAEQEKFMQEHQAAASMVGRESWPAAEGGRARQRYGLGSLVKKAFKAVKKIAKSPVGMAALMAIGLPALGKFGAAKGWAGFGPESFLSTLGRGGWKTALMGAAERGGGSMLPGHGTGKAWTRAIPSLWDRIKGNPMKSIGLMSMLPFLFQGKGEDEPSWAGNYGEGIDPEAIRRKILAGGVDRAKYPFLQESQYAADGGRIGYQDGRSVRSIALNQLYGIAPKRKMAQEGGLMDMGGMEKDYREEGGFVPIGGQERADDVPARLSKNEFVFTADAVRAAGGGDIDAGAEVMENVMNNLEQGGQVSEESQGLEGARNMFATAQRLEGVL